jgi:cytochrome c553
MNNIFIKEALCAQGNSGGYLKHQLQACRSGKRRREVMLVMDPEVTDDELKAMARYYSHIRI